jgi:hypothetical protein
MLGRTEELAASVQAERRPVIISYKRLSEQKLANNIWFHFLKEKKRRTNKQQAISYHCIMLVQKEHYHVANPFGR